MLVLTLFAGCADDGPSEQTCEAYQYCCSWRCTTLEEHRSKGPDACDCDTTDTATAIVPGECLATEDGCVFVEPS